MLPAIIGDTLRVLHILLTVFCIGYIWRGYLIKRPVSFALALWVTGIALFYIYIIILRFVL
jgi:hypothetical protein